jgi:hypothetical protein
MWRTAVQSRKSLVAGLLFFIAAQALFNIVADTQHPGLYDPEYGIRLALLRARLAETPDHPLLVMIGSSRTAMCFKPELLAEMRTSDGTPMLPFNFCHLAAGPVMNVLEYRRLRSAGIRPAWVIMEVMPPALGRESSASLITCANVYDLPLLSRYIDRPKLYGRFLTFRLIPWHRHRNEIVHSVAPALVTPGTLIDGDDISLGPLGGDADWIVHAAAPPEVIRRWTDHARMDYWERLQHFHIVESATRAYHELLEMCREDGVELRLLLAPEGTEFRSWYAADALRQLDAWCAEMRSAHGARIIDARAWLPDSDFIDGHHVLAPGAEHFTQRLEQEVLRPLLNAETKAP